MLTYEKILLDLECGNLSIEDALRYTLKLLKESETLNTNPYEIKNKGNCTK